MSIDVKGGPTISVRNEQLVVPHVKMDSASASWKQDMRTSDLLINSMDENYDQTHMTFGRFSMTNMYLMVNLDAGEFTIWPANTGSNTETPVAVDDSGKVLEDSPFCTTATAPTQTDPQATKTGSASSKLPTGSIVGISIGSVAALVISALGAWWFLRRRTRQKREQVPEVMNGTTSEAAAYQASWATQPPPFANDPNKHNGTTGDRSTMLSSASFVDVNHPSGMSNPSELSSTPTYGPNHHELQG
jgi:hypothetical protein